jgi:NAD(P)-dependent dehydrogenase (short-subunit alcohol dehydrogenase family)
MAGRLAGKVAIVTGAASGIGRAAAELFAAEGAKVMCADINEALVKEVAAGINAKSAGAALALKVDVGQPADIERMVADTVKAFGKLNVLYANAGIGDAATAESLTIEAWNRMIAINLTSVWLSCKYALPHMIAAGGGSIVNQSSLAGLIGVPSLPHYAAAKAGVIGLTRQIAVEYGPKGIRANAICPGTIYTPLVATVWERRGVGYGASPGASLAEQKKQAGMGNPIQRMGEVADCANLALFLASDESGWITGTAMPLDGGRSAA